MRILIYPVLSDFRRIRPVHGIYYHVRPIPLPAGQHTSDQSPCNLRHINFLKLTQAVRAVFIVIRSILPKIPEDIIPQAFIGKAVEGHLPQSVPVPLRHQIPDKRIHFLIILVIVNKELVRNHILSDVQLNTLRRFPTSPGRAELYQVSDKYIKDIHHKYVLYTSISESPYFLELGWRTEGLVRHSFAR